MYRFIFLISLLFYFIQAEFVNLEKAQKVAINQIIYNTSNKASIESIYTIKEGSLALIYIFNIIEEIYGYPFR